jgi:hypothetical protein
VVSQAEQERRAIEAEEQRKREAEQKKLQEAAEKLQTQLHFSDPEGNRKILAGVDPRVAAIAVARMNFMASGTAYDVSDVLYNAAGVGGVVRGVAARLAAGRVAGAALTKEGAAAKAGTSAAKAGEANGLPKADNWSLGSGKSAAKWERQMDKRGWTKGHIDEAVKSGSRYPARNSVNPANEATRFVHPETGRSVVIDNVTRDVIHVGGDGFKY